MCKEKLSNYMNRSTFANIIFTEQIYRTHTEEICIIFLVDWDIANRFIQSVLLQRSKRAANSRKRKENR